MSLTLPTLQQLPLEALTSSISVRQIREAGVQQLMKAIDEMGFLSRYPIAVEQTIDGYRVLDGHHRIEAARRLHLDSVPAHVYEEMDADTAWKLAYQSNLAHEAVVPQTFVDDAQLVWTLADNGRTQPQIAHIVGWSREKVAQYAQLSKICPEAWQLIVTTFSGFCNAEASVLVTDDVTNVTKSQLNEGILRHILLLTPSQQLELVKLLLKDPKNKEDYRKRAQRYRSRNALTEEARRILKVLPPSFLERALTEITKGQYDAEWLAQKTPGPHFQKLMQQLLDEYAKKQNYTIHCGDFTTILTTHEADSVDVIITDPPYEQSALPLYEALGKVAAHVLKPGGSLIVMSGQSYLPDILNAISGSLRYHWCLAYMTPGGQAVQLWQRQVNTFWKPVLWFVKGTYDGKWAGDVCKSAVNDNDKRFHKWGQSESGMLDLVERISQPGDTVCDPCMGAGTTGIAALSLGRKFIGIDKDETCVEHATERLQACVAASE